MQIRNHKSEIKIWYLEFVIYNSGMFRKKKPKRLYYPTRSRWYTRPKRRPVVRSTRKKLGEGAKGYFKKFLKSHLSSILIGLIILMITLFLFLSSYFTVTGIQVTREDFNTDTAAVSNQLNEYIGKNILFLPRYRIVEKIQESFPEFSSVKIRKSLPHNLIIELESHEIIANLRAYYILPEQEIKTEEVNESILKIDEALDAAFSFGEEEEEKEPEKIEQKCLLNEIGQAIFDREENLELMTIIIEDMTQPIEDREVVMSEDKMEYFQGALKYFNNLFKIQIEKVYYLPTAREIHFMMNNGTSVWLTMERDYKKQIDKMNTIYIDLRVKEKGNLLPTKIPLRNRKVKNLKY